MFEHCLYFNTTALARRLEKEWLSAFAPFDLSPPQAFMLRVVNRKPGIWQHALADELGVARATATRLLDQLESRALVVRRTDPADARKLEIYPTPRAVDLREPIELASGKVTARLKKVLGEQPFDDVVRQVRGVRSALK